MNSTGDRDQALAVHCVQRQRRGTPARRRCRGTRAESSCQSGIASDAGVPSTASAGMPVIAADAGFQRRTTPARSTRKTPSPTWVSTLFASSGPRPRRASASCRSQARSSPQPHGPRGDRCPPCRAARSPATSVSAPSAVGHLRQAEDTCGSPRAPACDSGSPRGLRGQGQETARSPPPEARHRPLRTGRGCRPPRARRRLLGKARVASTQPLQPVSDVEREASTEAASATNSISAGSLALPRRSRPPRFRLFRLVILPPSARRHRADTLDGEGPARLVQRTATASSPHPDDAPVARAR